MSRLAGQRVRAELVGCQEHRRSWRVLRAGFVAVLGSAVGCRG